MWDEDALTARILAPDALRPFDGRPGALALYEALARRLLAEFPQTDIRPTRTQVSFRDGRVYACASLAPAAGPARARPDPYLTVTFGLPAPLASPRVVAVPVRPGRITHHVYIGRVGDIDAELIDWLRQAHAFAGRPGRAQIKDRR